MNSRQERERKVLFPGFIRGKMRKKYIAYKLLGIIMGITFMSGCGLQGAQHEREYTYWNSIALGHLDENGYYFLNNVGMLYYFDISADITIPVCDKAECQHQHLDYNMPDTAKCNAQLDCLYNGFAVYNNKIYYYKSGNDMNRMELHSRELDGTNDKKIAVLKANSPECEGLFYEDKLLTVGMFYASESFNAETRQSEDSYLKLFLVDLKTGEVEEIDQSTQIHNDYAYGMRKGENKKIYYYRMQDNQFYSVNIDTGEKEVEEVAFQKNGFDNNDFNKQVGIGWRYTLFRGDYCFGQHIENGKTAYTRLNIETGEINEYLVVEDTGEYTNFVGDAYFGKDVYYIRTDIEHPENNKIFICDVTGNKLTELKGKFIQDLNYGTPWLWTDTGAIFCYQTVSEDMTNQILEYRYFSKKNLVDGNDKYQIIYEQIQ